MTTTSTIANLKKYCESLTAYKRRATIPVMVGSVGVGGDNPIRIQSMTTVDTMDTQGSVEQSIRMIESGCEIVRITAPSLKEAQNLQNIKKELRARGYDTPLVADIHFTPNAAEVAAGIVEKVRVNPGNYADKKKFQTIEYTDETYQAEIDRIREKFLPLVKLCKENGTAMRIGTNHGSLSDRIMSRYGDTPLGMVESALEFVRICESESYYDIIISMKASNPKVMVEAYRLLVKKLDEEGLKPYPLHIGVTEAGEGDDGRIKSAVGIGTLLEDGLGDTIRVSLTEDPEFESPVGKKLADRYLDRAEHSSVQSIEENPINPFDYQQRKTREVFNIGGDNVPRVIADYSNVDQVEYADLVKVSVNYDAATDKFNTTDSACDFIYTGSKSIGFMLPNGVREIQDYTTWVRDKDLNKFPLYQFNEYVNNYERHPELNFLLVKAEAVDDEVYTLLKNDLSVVLVLDTDNKHAMPAQRRVFFELVKRGIDVPVIILRKYPLADDEEELQLFSATDMGGLLIDGFGDGVFLSTELYTGLDRSTLLNRIELHNKTSFGILQATRTRISKTEYISCPSCGRTLFDLQETTAMIRKRTDHLKGVKIGIMGCIVNGPGEMADADYGYVGVGKGKIALYREKTVVKKSVPAEHAVDELIELIREDGRWIEPGEVKN